MTATAFSTLQRQVWAEMFGSGVQEIREQHGRSIEQAAELASMTPQAWTALEAGQAPERPEQMHQIAAGLGISFGELVPLILFCQDAWY